MKKIFSVRTMAEVAIFAALGYVLDALAGAYSAPIFVNGGSIGIAMVCVYIVAYRRGTIPGILTGLIMGLFDIADGFYAVAGTWYYAFAQVALDYWIAYPMVGLAGLTRKLAINAKSDKERGLYVGLGCVISGLLKLLCHYLAGVIFWGDPSGFQWTNFTNPYIYSLAYNCAYVLPCIVLSTAIMVTISIKWPNFITEPDNNKFMSRKKIETSEKKEEVKETKKGEAR